MNVKFIQFAVVLFFLNLISTNVQSQSLIKPELSVFYGYGFASRLPIYDGYLRSLDAPIYGGAIAIPLPMKQDVHLEVSYLRQDTKIEAHLGNYYGNTSKIKTSYNVAYNYFQLKGIHNIIRKENQRAVPYIGLGIGALWFENKEPEYVDYVRFAFSVTGGAKIRLNDHFGLRLEGLLNAPIQGAGLYLGVGSGGLSTGVSTSSSILQFGISSGLIFYLGK
jgi:hypothetical protein